MDPQHLVVLGIGALGGLVSSLLVYGILALKCFRLQLALQATQHAVLGLRNSEKSNKRWEKERTLKEDMELFEQRTPLPVKEKFANDPLTFGG